MSTQDIFLCHMLHVLSAQIFVAFTNMCLLFDSVIRPTTTWWTVVTGLLFGASLVHAAWSMYRFPQFYDHTDHTVMMNARNPYVHPDYLHPEHTDAFNAKMDSLSVRHELLRKLSSPSLLSHSMHSPAIPINTFQLLRPAIHAPPDEISYDKLELFHTDHIVMKPAALLPLIMSTQSSTELMETNGMCGGCLCTTALKSVSIDEEVAWIRQYVIVHTCLFLTAMSLDLFVDYRDTWYVFPLITNALRVYALWSLLPPSHLGLAAMSSPENPMVPYPTNAEDVVTPKLWYNSVPRAFVGLLFLAVVTILYVVLLPLMSEDQPLRVGIAIELCLGLSLLRIRTSSLRLPLVLWLACNVLILSLHLAERLSIGIVWSIVTIVICVIDYKTQ